MLKEASMNISMTGNTSSEVLELMAILKNAGLDTAHLVTDMDINQPMPDEGDHMCPACAAAHSMDTPCGEAVEEEYVNSPDEEYQDDSYMLQDLSGGLNRKKDKGALRAKDPAITYEQKLKAQLKKNLNEKYEKLDEFGWDDIVSGAKKAWNTVTGGAGNNNQQQTTQAQATSKGSGNNNQQQTTQAQKGPKQIKTNANRIANYDKRIANIKRQPENWTQKVNTNGQVTQFTRDQYIEYLTQQKDFLKNGGDVFGLTDKDAEFQANALKKKSAATNAAQQPATNDQQPATNDQQGQSAPEINPKITNASKKLVQYLTNQGLDKQKIAAFFTSLV